MVYVPSTSSPTDIANPAGYSVHILEFIKYSTPRAHVQCTFSAAGTRHRVVKMRVSYTQFRMTRRYYEYHLGSATAIALHAEDGAPISASTILAESYLPILEVLSPWNMGMLGVNHLPLSKNTHPHQPQCSAYTCSSCLSGLTAPLAMPLMSAPIFGQGLTSSIGRRRNFSSHHKICNSCLADNIPCLLGKGRSTLDRCRWSNNPAPNAEPRLRKILFVTGDSAGQLKRKRKQGTSVSSSLGCELHFCIVRSSQICLDGAPNGWTHANPSGCADFCPLMAWFIQAGQVNGSITLIPQSNTTSYLGSKHQTLPALPSPSSTSPVRPPTTFVYFIAYVSRCNLRRVLLEDRVRSAL